ncbi:cation/H(+) antiporter 15-like isoform X2 [Tripterygium wilfordii]|uniref:cation/H(+) antiporter 15-like isoform X2 n=1 Tax=Tripterygium wilfordii TaxID=458696 RepID=UPI0018F80E08|nr:cation/H(+) antiporter 15-like isoform X2 [Tripterygium wilfordii]
MPLERLAIPNIAAYNDFLYVHFIHYLVPPAPSSRGCRHLLRGRGQTTKGGRRPAMDIPLIPDGSACFLNNVTATNGIWVSENPLGESMPRFILQLAVIIVITRTINLLLIPLHQPRFIADLLGGLLIGPSALGKTKYFLPQIFPVKTITTIETMAYLSLVYYSFVVGLRTDLSAALRTGKKSLLVVAGGVIFPISVGIGLFFMLNNHHLDDRHSHGGLFWALALSVTGFPVVTEILSDLKLLHTDIGRMALSTSIVNDLCCWVLLIILVPVRVRHQDLKQVIVSTTALLLGCMYGVRPLLSTIIRRTFKGDKYSKPYMCSFLIALALCALCSEACGVTSIVGAFIFGLIIPNGTLAAELTNKFEDFASGTMLPLFFAICGIRININSIENWGIAAAVIVISCAVKILSTMAIFFFHNMAPREGFALGVIMNTKGVLAIVVLNMGWDNEILKDQDYAIMAVAVFVMTAMVPPIMSHMYKPAKRLMDYQRRSVIEAKSEADLRILTCVYDSQQLPGLLSLLDASRASNQSSLHIFVLQLVEFKGRASAMLIVHNTRKSGGSVHRHVNSDTDQIVSAFESFELKNGNVSVQPFTAMSPFSTMHEDVCGVAENKNIAFMILPFHKQVTADGNFEETNPSFRGVVLNVLANTPCSVGMFVDRGFKGLIGGYHRSNLTVVRFLPNDNLDKFEVPVELPDGSTSRLLTASSFVERQKTLDDEYITEFRVKSADNQHLNYVEKRVDDAEGVIAELKALGDEYDLYVVGKGEGVVSPLTAALLVWCELPELGAVGDVLVSSAFCRSSVIVVQRYAGSGDVGGTLASSP